MLFRNTRLPMVKRAATFRELARAMKHSWKRNTTNNKRLALATRVLLPRDASNHNIGGVTDGLGRAWIRKDRGWDPAIKRVTSVNRGKIYRLSNYLTWAHEAVERKHAVKPWDKADKLFSGDGWAHHGIAPLLAEHNIIRSMKPALNPRGSFIRRARDRDGNWLLGDMIPGFDYGKSPRLSRHAIKRLREAYNAGGLEPKRHGSRQSTFLESLGTKKASDSNSAYVMIQHPNGRIKTNLSVELALTAAARSRGLSNRKSLDANSGMLFTRARTFWMKDTLIPLDIMFADKDGKILSIKHMPVEKNPKKPTRTYVGPPATIYALEVNKGWCKANKIQVGDVIVVHS